MTESTGQTIKMFHSADLHLNMHFPLQHSHGKETYRQVFYTSLAQFAQFN